MQSTHNILMIRPVNFGFNEQTATSNAFQNQAFGEANKMNAQKEALHEFDAMVEQLRSIGVNVMVIEDTSEPQTPDSIFPNNWISFHEDGSIVTYPMQAENRRLERRKDIIETIGQQFIINNQVDLTYFEKEGKYLEGTGSMVLDRANKIAYACISPRTNLDVLDEFGRQMNYEIVAFDATDSKGKQIYHTNVLMCIGNFIAVICLEAIQNLDQRMFVKNKLENSGKRIIEISLEQMNNFAGNMLEIEGKNEIKYLVMSASAYHSLKPEQIEILDDYCTLLYFDLGMIEGNGGGSARCMMAEVHLPKID